ncbi:HepT-like ribonuclease domain-containing protein [Halomonas sp. LBP4]|nr:HepT-like ribonuclease domain-containing protein [Halomonas sp. LBP4]
MIGFAEKVLAYLGIDDDIVWSIVQTQIPELLASLRSLTH